MYRQTTATYRVPLLMNLIAGAGTAHLGFVRVRRYRECRIPSQWAPGPKSDNWFFSDASFLTTER